MMTFEEKLNSIKSGKSVILEMDDLVDGLLNSGKMEELLFNTAENVLLNNVGKNCYLRGIVEVSNRCQKNCLYCGLRRDNDSFARFTMTFDEVIQSLNLGYQLGLRSFLLQTGELLGEDHINLIEKILFWTSDMWGESVRMVLSLGELPKNVLKRLLKAGGARYLLRIETSNHELYMKLHPKNGIHRFSERKKCLSDLRETGWQTGSGVLIGVPWQTSRELAEDIMFLKEIDIDMCGMGPYIEMKSTPLFNVRHLAPSKEDRFKLSLRMIALARIIMPTINIAATTALQTLNPKGLEMGLRCGANVFMPNLTPRKYRDRYVLYEGKASVYDRPEDMLKQMPRRCRKLGRKLVLKNSGDPIRFIERKKLRNRAKGMGRKKPRGKEN